MSVEDYLFNPRDVRSLAKPVMIENANGFGTYTFRVANVAKTVLSDNPRRTSLVIQNLDATADMYFNFNGAASVENGALLSPLTGVILDVVCPKNSVSVIFDSVTECKGMIMEGAYNL